MENSIRRLFLVLVLMFLVLVAWTSRWTVFDAPRLRANPLNARPLFASLQVRRGSIESADGLTIARSVRSARKTFRTVYPTGSLFGHPVGYADLLSGQVSGLEAYRNAQLSGQTSEFGSFITQLTGTRQEGATVVTTLDAAAQRIATDQLAATRSGGSVVALDPRTGAVRVMVSLPGYNPNVAGDHTQFAKLLQSHAAPLLDRATQAAYPPGSTFKLVTAAAALDSERFTPTSLVNGDSPKLVSGVMLRNDGDMSYGNTTLSNALTYSVNTVFAQVGEELGRSTMARYMRAFGFYNRPPLDYPASQMIASGERGSKTHRLLPPTSPQVDLGRMAIGQDKLSVTPMQMAMVVAAIADGGVLMEPHLTDRIIDPDGRTVVKVAPRIVNRPIKRTTAVALTQMMRNVVEEGTGTAVRIPGIAIAGKTGTAEVGQPGTNITQPWFVAFAPADHPRIAIAVTVERSVGGFGGTVAAPIARAVLSQLLQAEGPH